MSVRDKAGEEAANFILARAAEVYKMYGSIQNRRSPFLQTDQYPYGAPLFSRIILTPQLADNNLVIATLGDMEHHVVAIRNDVMVEVSREAAFEENETIVRGTVYAANVVINPVTMFRVTAANLYQTETFTA